MNRQQHMVVNEALLGYTNESVHTFTNHSAAWLRFGHISVRYTTETIEYLEIMKGESTGRIALLHILIDNPIVDREWSEAQIDK